MLTVLDDAAEQGLVADLSEKLDLLERNTRFYISKECKRIIEGMKERTGNEGPPSRRRGHERTRTPIFFLGK